ncbi:hypothetical protein B566_EDAN009662 [Ephemera danica]|nr:hypothetical protein B566_EDAN009662 [Ephemera danica]
MEKDSSLAQRNIKHLICGVSSFLLENRVALHNFEMTRGNQRELARAKNQKKLQEQQRKKGGNDKESNKGMNLEQRKQRDADLMREKQQKALEKEKEGKTSSS